MTISVWRYCHLALAISSSFFLLFASITGVILAFEPVLSEVDAIGLKANDSQPLIQLLASIDAQFDEVFSVKKKSNGSIEVHGVFQGNDQNAIINPATGEPASEVQQQSSFFQFITSLHRSLFLGSIGRALIGINSLLLLLIAATGVVLIIKRTSRLLGFFSPVIKTNKHSFLHILLGKWTLIPLVVIALSGVLLSLVRFSIIPTLNISHSIDFDTIEESPVLRRNEFPIFNTTTIKDFREIEYPFFEDPEEFYRISLRDREVLVNQFTGNIESEQNYPWTEVVSSLSLVLHTGQGNWFWAILLGFASVSLPLFIYSGFALTFQRRRALIKNKYAKKDCDFIILVGSENGSTTQFAKAFQEALIRAGKKAFLEELNHYRHYENLKHLIVFTSTYGAGDPPSNATKFAHLYSKNTRNANDFAYSVVGFGSTSYREFCKYAYELNQTLNSHPKSNEFLPVHTVNNQSFESLTQWANRWSAATDIPIKLSKAHISNEYDGILTFNVSRKTNSKDNIDGTFLLFLEQKKGPNLRSGDLLAVIPPGETRARYYSIGALDQSSIVLSIKKHEQGICSTYLNDLEPNATVTAHLKRNSDFHFPQKAKQVVMIATGTGIGPFLGMIQNNISQKEISLYWGGKYEKSQELYNDYLENWLRDGKLRALNTAFSRQYEEKIYVQHLIERDAGKIADMLKNKGVVMICGSTTMQQGVTDVLSEICESSIGQPLSFFINKKQIRMDCY